MYNSAGPPLTLIGAASPVGGVMAFAGVLGAPQPATATPPDTPTEKTNFITDPIEAWGWMLCDGRQLTPSEYPELFTVLGYFYGGKDERFNIPDYRGYFLRGIDAGSGNDPDVSQRTPPNGGSSEQVGSTQTDALQLHRHTYTEPSGSITAGQGPANAVLQAQPNQCTGYPDDSTCNKDVKTSKNETRPKNIYVNYIIKFTYGTLLQPNWPQINLPLGQTI
ncbi:MAG: phage tail protein [Candidatus Polarisedimenticolaceae bacterium]|nr:phage tail protein [Candidatus Polarisedimenticolaceae bacterium]